MNNKRIIPPEIADQIRPYLSNSNQKNLRQIQNQHDLHLDSLFKLLDESNCKLALVAADIFLIMRKKENVAKAIQFLREKKGLTKEDLAEEMSTSERGESSVGALKKLEKNANCNISTLVKAVAALDTTILFLTAKDLSGIQTHIRFLEDYFA